jgi:hypothetical protein
MLTSALKRRASSKLHQQPSNNSKEAEACRKALQLYMHEARKMCKMLTSFEADTANVTRQVDLISQRERENEALANYLTARSRLMRSAGLRAARSSGK